MHFFVLVILDDFFGWNGNFAKIFTQQQLKGQIATSRFPNVGLRDKKRELGANQAISIDW